MAEISKIDYKVGQDNVQFLGLDIHNPVFVVSSLTIIAFVAGVLVFQAGAATAFGALRAWLMSTFDWVFMGAGNLFVLFCLLLVATPLGRVRLGGADARPDYSRSAWFAMLFAAGMGIGLMFFGVSEPVEHFLQLPLGLEADDTAAARLGMVGAIYHWGIHGWAMYAVVALSIAFASYNLGLPMTLRSAFYPLMGEAVWGRFGHGIDILAVFATLFGLATSLGLGAQQLAAGLAHLWGTPATDTTRVLLIIGITGMALASVVSGMERGIKRLSEVNLLLALLLLAFVLTVGPTRDIATDTVTSLGQYLATIGPLSNWVGREDLDFMHGWTIFFWAWWISWSPFVGLFIARVVHGRLGGRGRCLSCTPQPRGFLPRAASRLASGSRLSDPKRTAATVTGSRGVKFINLVGSRGLSAQNPLWVRPCGYPPVFLCFRKTARPESARLFGPGTAERDVAYHLTNSRSRVDFADGQICPKFAFSSFDFAPWQRRLTGD